MALLLKHGGCPLIDGIPPWRCQPGRKRLDLWLSLDCSEWRLDPRAHDLSRWTIPHPDHYEGNIKWHATSPLRDATVIESA